MHTILRTLRTQWLGALGLLVGVTGAAYGATGQPAILGRANQSDAPTVLQNTAAGPAAAFVTKATQPPFTVTSSKQVPRLNASKLGGRAPGAYARAATTYRKGQADRRYAPRSGSTEYLGASAPQLLLIRAPGREEDVPGKKTTVLSDTVTPPADGTLVVRFTGLCSSQTSPGVFTLAMANVVTGAAADSSTHGGGLSQVDITVAPTDPADLCDTYIAELKAEGQPVEIELSITNGDVAGSKILVGGVVEVFFQP